MSLNQTASGQIAAAALTATAQNLLRRTPDQILGPFYPTRDATPDRSGDLTGASKAEGQMLYISGRVLDTAGTPVPGAKITIWQANRHGRYTHPNDINPAPLDPHFDGYSVITTDAEGRYQLKTIKPGAYPTGPATMRPSHIHFEVEGRLERLITQMYFEGDPHHEEDRFLRSATRPEALKARLLPPAAGMEREARRVEFDFVLVSG